MFDILVTRFVCCGNTGQPSGAHESPSSFQFSCRSILSLSFLFFFVWSFVVCSSSAYGLWLPFGIFIVFFKCIHIFITLLCSKNGFMAAHILKGIAVKSLWIAISGLMLALYYCTFIKHVHDCIISIRGEFWTYKSSLTPPLLIEEGYVFVW